MDAKDWFLITVGVISVIGLILIPPPDTDDEKESKVKKFCIFLIVLALVCVLRLYIFCAEPTVRNPSTGFGDTEVDHMLDEIKADGEDIYTEEEVLHIVYKYLRPYTREGKYEHRTVFKPVDDGGGRMTNEEAIKTLKENYCAICAYGSQDMDSCDIRSCDNRDAIKVLEQDTVPFDLDLYQAGLMDMPKEMIEVLDEIQAELYANAELHEDGDYYLREEWIGEIFDKYKDRK